MTTLHAAASPRPTSRVRASIALTLALLLSIASALFIAPPAHGAVGNTYKYFNGSTGSSIKLVAPYDSGTYATTAYNLAGQSGVASTTGNYSVNFTGSAPSTNNVYVERAWARSSGDTALLSDLALSNQGAVEWILKNSVPTISRAQLLTNVRADSTLGFPANGNWYNSNDTEPIAGTQAAIWHFTDGVDLDLNSSVNSERVKKLYTYLITHAEGQLPSSSDAPTLTLSSANDRTAFDVAPAAQFGPFTVTSSTPVTLSVSGDQSRIVDVEGQALTGAQASGTQFWLRPTTTPTLDGSATITATSQSVTSTVLHAAFGNSHTSPFAPRETLAQLQTVTQTATPQSLKVSWTIDQTSPADYDATTKATQRSFVYNLAYEQSATLQDLYFTDGSHAKSDLIGLSGAAESKAYSADYAATASSYSQFGPTINDQTTFIETDWSDGTHTTGADTAAPVTWVLQNSAPQLSLAELTSQVNASQSPSAITGNIKNYDAYAATQAAIWHYTDGKDLDTTRYADPTAATDSDDAPAVGLLTGDGWTAPAAGPVSIDFDFPAKLELSSYTVTRSDAASAPAGWRLQRLTADGTYQDVSTTAVKSTDTRYFADGTQTSVNVGASATYGGYTRYRLVIDGATDPSLPVHVQSVSFSGLGVFGSSTSDKREYANATPVVLAYKHLLAGAEQHTASVQALQSAPTATITGPATAQRENLTDLIGPFTYDGSTAAKISIPNTPEALLLKTSDGTPTTTLTLAPGETFWVSAAEISSGQITLEAVGAAKNWISARALNGTYRTAIAAQLVTLGTASVSTTAAHQLSLSLLPDAQITLDQTVVSALEQVTISGSNYRPGETVELQLHSEVIALGAVTAGADGTFSQTLTIPS